MNAKTPSASKSTERALAQRERIMCAAKKCFIEHGFHAAGMALIAETADMSPGLIYRYFDSKDAIILAIIEQQLVESRNCIRALHDAPDFEAAVFEAFDQWRKADPAIMNAALFLEMSAEATRNPVLAAALHASDLALREEVANWLAASVSTGGKGMARETAELRAISMQCFMEGLAIRALREPDIAADQLQVAIAHFAKSLFAS